ncbi:hypothetical protein EVAR_36241_1 [Eumeta japonica]|uniref:Uncharacterized protein n=1 Tax=Eumeta variegata TaxID=151549 RepID=A0A4C1WVR1_EUMVA|nr:hypothetical protein EVAR_36241_1 [Eumeta japonica]
MAKTFFSSSIDLKKAYNRVKRNDLWRNLSMHDVSSGLIDTCITIPIQGFSVSEGASNRDEITKFGKKRGSQKYKIKSEKRLTLQAITIISRYDIRYIPPFLEVNQEKQEKVELEPRGGMLLCMSPMCTWRPRRLTSNLMFLGSKGKRSEAEGSWR